jgi:hypothetical protein
MFCPFSSIRWKARIGTPLLEMTFDLAMFLYLNRGPATPMAD